MKVQLTASRVCQGKSGHTYSQAAKEIVDVEQAEGERLIRAGHARRVDEKKGQ